MMLLLPYQPRRWRRAVLAVALLGVALLPAPAKSEASFYQYQEDGDEDLSALFDRELAGGRERRRNKTRTEAIAGDVEDAPTAATIEAELTESPTEQATEFVTFSDVQDEADETTAFTSSVCSAHEWCVEEFGKAATEDTYCCPTRMGCYYECCFVEMNSDGGAAPIAVLEDAPGGVDATNMANGTCASNAACYDQGYRGECCPSEFGTYMTCCDDEVLEAAVVAGAAENTCSTNSECDGLGLVGACCPTEIGVYLDCCDFDPSDDGTCSTNAQCADLGLGGECCPTREGVYLDCCDDIPPDEGTCQDNRKCRRLNLNGECCPTITDTYLSCCNDIPVEEGSQGTCTTYKNCDDLGLTGSCCPTDDDAYLDCCIDTDNLEEEAKCAANEKCSELGLAGWCCPTAVDVYLDCCEAVNDVDFVGVVSKEYELATLGFEETSSADAAASVESVFFLGCWTLMMIAPFVV